jgi:hypothetical protein
MGWTIGVLGFESRREVGIFLFTTVSRQELRLTQSPIRWVLGALSLRVKRPGREADHSPPSSAEVKKAPPIRLHVMVPIFFNISWQITEVPNKLFSSLNVFPSNFLVIILRHVKHEF